MVIYAPLWDKGFRRYVRICPVRGRRSGCGCMLHAGARRAPADASFFSSLAFFVFFLFFLSLLVRQKDIAATIKKDFDQLHGPKWHCIVGRHFGSFVTAESDHFVHLYLGKVRAWHRKDDIGGSQGGRVEELANV